MPRGVYKRKTVWVKCLRCGMAITGDETRVFCDKCRKIRTIEIRNNRFNRKPWEKTHQNIRKRCSYPKDWHCRIGIKNLITKEELKKIWFRDKGFNMKQPTIDRIDNMGHYIYANCRYLEREDNMKRRVFDKIELRANYIKLKDAHAKLKAENEELKSGCPYSELQAKHQVLLDKITVQRIADIIAKKCKEITAEWWEKDAEVYAKAVVEDLLEE